MIKKKNPPKVKPEKSALKAKIEKPTKFNAMDHWKGMPEFNQPNASATNKVIVNFANVEDMHKFSKLVGQTLTAKTKSIWYPKADEECRNDKRYSDKKK